MTAMNVMNVSSPRCWDDDLRLYAQSGDADAFARLTRRYIDVVYTFCRRHLADAHLAEDATQAVFILLAQRARTFRQGVVLSGWLFDTSRYCCNNARRAAARRVRHETEAAHLRPETVENSAKSIGQAELEQSLHRAMSRLRTSERDTLLLRYFERLSHREIAQHLKITEEAAKQRLARGLRKLRELMGTGQAGASSSMVALPVWMETHALGSAPLGLASSTADLALGKTAASSASAIASAASAAMVWFKVQLILGALIGAVLVVGGVALVAQALQTSPTPSTSAPPAATQPVALTGQMTPIDAIRTLGQRLDSLDIDGVKNVLVIPDNDEGQVVLAAVRLNMAETRIHQAMRTLLGQDFKTIRLTEMTIASILGEALKHIGADDVKINGDQAIVSLRFGPAGAANPVLKMFEGLPLHLARADGAWKVDFLNSVTCANMDPAGRKHKVAPKAVATYFDSIVQVADGMMNDALIGQLTDISAFPQTFQHRLAERLVKNNLQAIYGITVVPKAQEGELLPPLP